jgi:hypothetical protein
MATATITFETQIIRSVFGEVGYTPSSMWDKELQSMIDCCTPSEDEEKEADYWNEFNCETLDLVFVFQDKAVYKSEKQGYNVFEVYGDYLQTEESQWTTDDLSSLIPEEFQAVFKNKIYSQLTKEIDRIGISDWDKDQHYIKDSLLDPENSVEWVIDNIELYDTSLLWMLLKEHAKSFAKQLAPLDNP